MITIIPNNITVSEQHLLREKLVFKICTQLGYDPRYEGFVDCNQVEREFGIRCLLLGMKLVSFSVTNEEKYLMFLLGKSPSCNIA